MNTSSTDHEKELALLRSMAIVPTVKKLEKLLTQLCDIDNQSLQRYFNKCWEPLAAKLKCLTLVKQPQAG